MLYLISFYFFKHFVPFQLGQLFDCNPWVDRQCLMMYAHDCISLPYQYLFNVCLLTPPYKLFSSPSFCHSHLLLSHIKPFLPSFLAPHTANHSLYSSQLPTSSQSEDRLRLSAQETYTLLLLICSQQPLFLHFPSLWTFLCLLPDSVSEMSPT